MNLKYLELISVRTVLMGATLLSMIALSLTTSFSQSDDAAKLRSEAFRLLDEHKLTEALPLLEKLAIATPKDKDVQRNLGFALMGTAKNTSNPAAAKQLRARARASFVKAREAGDDSQLVSGLIDSIAPDGGEDATFTSNAKADEIMQKAEAAFTSGKLDDALALYQQALKIDPKLYHAALFSGDVYLQKEKFADAEIWYQRAISIDPYIETAYRYSATPLMKQGKYDQARDRYIEAWIVEPYSKFAVQGMINWGNVTKTQLGHPKIDIPQTKVGADGRPKTTINLNPSVDEDGSIAWIAYSAIREVWKKEKFAKTYPAEKEYRHSLAEEVDALRNVVTRANALKPKSLNPQIATLEQLDRDGLLEAYVLMAIPTQGIAQDHAAYVRANRDKLRQYVLKYVIGGK